MYSEQHPPAPVRVGVFVAALVLVVSAGWAAGRVGSPPVPVPDLPTPAVFGGPGRTGEVTTGREDAGAAPVVPVVPGHGGHAG